MNKFGGQESPPSAMDHKASAGLAQPLSQLSRGSVGRILAVQGGEGDVERGLLEMGFVEGAAIEVLHLGLFGGDPIAVRLGDARVALRRREAHAILLSSAAA